MGNKLIDGIALTIAIIGAVNWGLIGFYMRLGNATSEA